MKVLRLPTVDHKYFMLKILLFRKFLIFMADNLCHICSYDVLTVEYITVSVYNNGSFQLGSQLTTTSTKLFGKMPSFPLMVLPLSQSLPTLDLSMIRSPAFMLSSSMLSAWKKKIESKKKKCKSRLPMLVGRIFSSFSCNPTLWFLHPTYPQCYTSRLLAL